MVAEVLTLTLTAVVVGVGVLFVALHFITRFEQYREELKTVERIRRELD